LERYEPSEFFFATNGINYVHAQVARTTFPDPAAISAKWATWEAFRGWKSLQFQLLQINHSGQVLCIPIGHSSEIKASFSLKPSAFYIRR
jgi:hypothetical protein